MERTLSMQSFTSDQLDEVEQSVNSSAWGQGRGEMIS